MADAHLSIESYDHRERGAVAMASYPALRAFAPISFAHANFPTRVTCETELRRYADIMYETRSREEWLKIKFYSRHEAEAMLQLSRQIERLTGKLFDKPTSPLMCLFAPVMLMRMIEHLSAHAGRRLTILEIGPGSGYLAAYLLNAGHRVIAVDNTQALYLWQNRLFSDYDLDEWALADVAPLRNAPGAQITHIPWWHFARFYEAALPIGADIVVCDAALGEMDHFAFRYVARIAKMLTEQSETGCLLYQNLGEERIQQRAYAEQYFSNVGFRLHKIGEVSVLVGSEQFPTGEIKDMKEPPPIGGDQGMQAPADFLDINREHQLC
jgi:SAM-dependent methyltransferase